MKFLLKKLWWIILLAIIIIIVIFKLIGSDAPDVEYTTQTVVRGDITQTVEATGKIEPLAQVDIKFLVNGILKENLVEVGSRAKKGDILLQLDDREMKFQLDQAQANLAQTQANLNQKLAGASSQEINVQQQSVLQAQTEYENAKANYELIKNQLDQDGLTSLESLDKAQQDVQSAKQALEDTIATQDQNILNYYNSAIITIDSALADCNVALDEVERILQDDEAQKHLGNENQQTKYDEMASREKAENSIITAENELDLLKLNITDEQVDETMDSAVTAVKNTFTELKNMFLVLSNTSSSFTFQESVLLSYKNSISTQQSLISADLSSVQNTQQNILSARLTRDSQINNAQSTLTTAENNLDITSANYNLSGASEETQLQAAQNQVNSAQAALNVAQAQLDLVKAPARSVDVASFQAAVMQSQAAYDLAEKKYQDTQLTAPIEGIVTDIYYDIGEQVSTATSAVSMMTPNNYEIKVDISEADIAKVKLNNKVQIDFDAFGDDQLFNGQVTFINPAQTEIQEVIYYEVTINFDKQEAQIKPGMTANITIFTDERTDVLYIPRRAVIDREGQKIVRVLEGNEPREIPVVTGLKADDGLIEIISGLNEGQEVITFIKEL